MKRQRNRWTTCARKHGFESYLAAERQRQAYEAIGVAGLVVYQCMCCWKWHLGHLTPRLQPSER